MSYPNRNTMWASVFVDELARSGLEAVCIAPGSRSTPLTLAFYNHPGVKVFSHLDERSAAFFALGHALGTGKPVALVCTSGTAAANFFPAVIEAYQAEVPLLLLTADRSHELRHSGANQTIDQVKLYGDYALWAVDMSLPEPNPPAVAIRNLRTTAARAYATANGLRKGPVHINFPFRKPLEPTEVESDSGEIPPGAEARDGAFTTFSRGRISPPVDVVQWVQLLINEHEKGIIVCGPRCPTEAFPRAVQNLSEQSGYPIFAGALSGLRFTEGVISSYETFLKAPSIIEPPEVFIRFGKVPTSKWLNAYLAASHNATIIHVAESGVWADDSHVVTHFVQADEALFCEAVTSGLTDDRGTGWAERISEVSDAAQQTILAELDTQPFDAAFVYDALNLTPEDSTILAGNSLPIRHVDQIGVGIAKNLTVYANRGASGIDGNTSTALGLGAANPDKPLVLITGDITFYHDMNGLLAVKRLGIPITIVLLNNGGGGIFTRLPIREFEPGFTDMFLTPHNLGFSHAAALYGLDYVITSDRQTFRTAFRDSVNNRTSTIIEVQTNAREDENRRQEITNAVLNKLKN